MDRLESPRVEPVQEAPRHVPGGTSATPRAHADGRGRGKSLKGTLTGHAYDEQVAMLRPEDGGVPHHDGRGEADAPPAPKRVKALAGEAPAGKG